MPTIKPLKRLLSEQGGLCFFCRKPLPNTEASVEHLVAISNGGSDCDDNLVACCKLLNNKLGSKSLKQKFQFFVNQTGQFQCPNGAQKKAAKKAPLATPKVTKPAPERYARVLTDLKKRGDARPRKRAALKNTIASLFPKKISKKEVAAIVQQLEREEIISTTGSKIQYASL